YVIRRTLLAAPLVPSSGREHPEDCVTHGSPLYATQRESGSLKAPGQLYTGLENLVSPRANSFARRMNSVVRSNTMSMNRRSVAAGCSQSGETHVEATWKIDVTHIAVRASSGLTDHDAELVFAEHLQGGLDRAHGAAIDERDHRGL